MPVHFQLLDSLLIVAMVAAQGTYNKQNIIRQYAFNIPNPIPLNIAANSVIPTSELIFGTANNTAQLDTTTSFAEIPAINATAICQYPNHKKTKNGSNICPITAPKLFVISVEYPFTPKFNKNHIIIEAINIVVPAFVK